MHLSKVITVLKVLDSPTLKRFSEYVNSDYFKVPKASVQLFNYLEPLHPNYKENKITPEVIASKEDNLPTAIKQSKAGTDLLKAFENFIAIEDCQSSLRNTAWHQLNSYKRLHLFELFDKEYEKEQKLLDECEEQDVDTFFYRHQFTELYYTGFDAKIERVKRTDLSPVVKTLDEYYALKRIRYTCEQLHRRQVFGIKFEEPDSQGLLRILEPYNNDKYPFVHLFIHVYRMLSAASYEDWLLNYMVIKQAVTNYSKDKLLRGLSEIINFAISGCIFWSSRGVDDAGKEYLWWIDFKMKWNILLENGKITPIAFRNVVSSATLYSTNPEWTKQFIRVYSQHLPAENRDPNVAFALGLYYYAVKDYSTSVRYFLNAQAKEEVIFNAIIRRWQWMATYEANSQETDLLLNQLLAFEKYLLRNKEEFHQFKAPFTVFISYAKRLIAVYNKSELTEAIDLIENEAHFPGKPWLIQQFNQTLQRGRISIRSLV